MHLLILRASRAPQIGPDAAPGGHAAHQQRQWVQCRSEERQEARDEHAIA